MSLRLLTSVLLCAAGAAVVVACGELKTATPSDADGGAASGANGQSGSSGSSGTSGSTPSVPGTTKQEPPPAGYGPGPHGALPSGYCCSSDDECRGRHCEDLGGGKMCLDLCRSNDTCQRPPELAWTCDNGGTPGDEGVCKPNGSFTCIPSASYELGSKVPGDCCTATGDGWAGLECLGGSCIAIGDSPFICNHRCVQPKDCPKGFVCQQINETRKECIPANRPYTCN